VIPSCRAAARGRSGRRAPTRREGSLSAPADAGGTPAPRSWPPVLTRHGGHELVTV